MKRQFKKNIFLSANRDFFHDGVETMMERPLKERIIICFLIQENLRDRRKLQKLFQLSVGICIAGKAKQELCWTGQLRCI